MAWSTLRRATDADMKAVRASAIAFCERHGIDYGDLEPEIAVDFYITAGNSCDEVRANRLRPLWRRILKRITGSPDGIAYGYVGSPIS